MGIDQSKLAFILLLVLFLYLQFFHQLGRLGLVGPDEPRYAQVAKEMAASNDFVTPRLYGKPWFEKPVLYYWLAALSYKLFGISEFAARLPSAVAGLLGCLAVFCIGRHWISFRCGLIAALLLASSPLYISLARAASTDMLLTSTLTLSLAFLYFLLIGRVESRRNTALAMCGFYGFLGLSVIAKGPVGLVLAGASLLTFLLLTRQFGLTSRIHPLFGGILFGMIALPWYFLCYRVNGWSFVQEFLLNHNLARFATDRFQHSRPFWWYLPVVFAGFFPWIFQLFKPASDMVRRGWQFPQEDFGKLLFWIWALVPFLFFSVSRSKLPGYVLPIFPVLALLAAGEWERLWKSDRVETSSNWIRVQSSFILALGVALPLGAGLLNSKLNSPLLPLTALLCGLGGFGLLLAQKRQWRVLLGSYVVGSGIMVLMILHGIVPKVDALESPRQLAAIMKKEGVFSGEPILIFGLSRRIEYGLNFYLDTETKIIYSEGDVDYPKQGGFFLVTEPSVNPEKLLPQATTESEFLFHEQKIVKMNRRIRL